MTVAHVRATNHGENFIYDGLLVRRHSSESSLDLDLWEAAVLADTGFAVRLAVKAWELNSALVGAEVPIGRDCTLEDLPDVGPARARLRELGMEPEGALWQEVPEGVGDVVGLTAKLATEVLAGQLACCTEPIDAGYLRVPPPHA